MGHYYPWMSMSIILDDMSLQQFLMYKEHMEFHLEGKRKIYPDEGVQRVSSPKISKPKRGR